MIGALAACRAARDRRARAGYGVDVRGDRGQRRRQRARHDGPPSSSRRRSRRSTCCARRRCRTSTYETRGDGIDHRRVSIRAHDGSTSARSQFRRSKRGSDRPSCGRGRSRSRCAPARRAQRPDGRGARAHRHEPRGQFPRAVAAGNGVRRPAGELRGCCLSQRDGARSAAAQSDVLSAGHAVDARVRSPVARRSAAAAGRIALLRRARLSARAVSADAGTIRDSAGAARLLAAAVGKLLQPRRDARARRPTARCIVAVEPPTPGRPADYGGAVGNLRVAAQARYDRRRASAIRCVLTVRVSGTGNVKLFPRPSVGVPWGRS